MTQSSTPTDYMGIGRQLAVLLGSSLEGPSGEALKELARAYHPSANEARISAEVFLFHKYLIVQSCVGMFPESQVERVIGGLFAALNEKATRLEFSPERQHAMEQMWQMRAKQFDRPFTEDREHFLSEGGDGTYWKQSLTRFCQNVLEIENPPDIWAGGKGPSHKASATVTETIEQLVSAMSEMSRLHFGAPDPVQ
ncbi:MAG: hypothetical protein GDA67_13185 [Nitrospira sp. CR1.3]|nr:hypothetical protein [Nitrospira sp. CR1.3]